MEREYDIANASEWVGSTNPLRGALSDIQPGFVPDTSFRQWPDQPERQPREEVMSLEDLAYCHSFLRNDLNVLVLLTMANIGTAHAHEVVSFLHQQDLSHRTSLDRTHVAPVLRELASCAYSGIYKASEDSFSPYEQLSNVEGLVSMAGNLYGFSKERPQPLSSFLGPASGHLRPDSTVYEGQNISNAMDRIKIVKYLAQSWKDNDLSFDFVTNQRAIEDDTGIRSMILEPQLKSLAQANLLSYKTTSPNEGPYQKYRWNRNGRKRKQWTQEHGAFAHYIHEYVMLNQADLSRQGARDYLLMTYPQFSEMDPSELDKRVEETINGLLARSFIRPDTPFMHGSQSSITFPRGTDGMSLLDYSRILTILQKEDTTTIEKGMRLAEEMSSDRQGITLLLRKAGR